MRRLMGLVAMTLVVGPLRAWAQQDDAPTTIDAAVAPTWREAAEQAGLDRAAIEQLERDRFVVTRQEFKQIFDPYVASKLPVFITADSLLSGFHVLYEESVLRLEENNARELPVLLRAVWDELQQQDAANYERPEEIAPALLRARVALGTAVQLFDPDKPVANGEVQELIAAEVARIVEGAAIEKPGWLGPPDRGFVALDYSRYKPRGFYTRSPALERYFRAVSWLQSIPFRVDRDEELVAMMLLARSIPNDDVEDNAISNRLDTFLAQTATLVGVGDDWDLREAVQHSADLLELMEDGEEGDAREDVRSWIEVQASDRGKDTINDQLAFIPDDPTAQAELSFRIVSARRTPDGVLLQRTTDPRKFPGRFPDGLEICAALGSPVARSRVEGAQSGLSKEIDDCRPYFQGQSLYQQYLDALSTLLDGPEPDAPTFMVADAWQWRNCQTALAGWAQLRHTWALQAKVTGGYFGGAGVRPGYIEPEPEFFSHMAALVERTFGVLNEADAFRPNPGVLAAEMWSLVELCEGYDVSNRGFAPRPNADGEVERFVVGRDYRILVELGAEFDSEHPGDEPEEVMARLRRLAEQLDRGQMPVNPVIAQELKTDAFDYAALWTRLASLSRRLESLAHKQLREVPMSRSDELFLKRYGAELANIMLYENNSYLVSNDDAPRIVDVFADPNSGRVLEVGIGRPRAMYVLYPDGDQQVLCRGAVSTYYEFPHESRLTDEEWMTLLDSPDRPDQPDWVPPVVNAATVAENDEMEDEDVEEEDIEESDEGESEPDSQTEDGE